MTASNGFSDATVDINPEVMSTESENPQTTVLGTYFLYLLIFVLFVIILQAGKSMNQFIQIVCLL